VRRVLAVVGLWFLSANACFGQNCVIVGSTINGSVEQHCTIINPRGKLDLYQDDEKVGRLSSVHQGPGPDQVTLDSVQLTGVDLSKPIELQDALLRCQSVVTVPGMRLNIGMARMVCQVVGKRNN